MQNFMSQLKEDERKIYQKVGLISSLHEQIFSTSKFNPTNKSSKIIESFLNEDLMNICKYSNPLIAPISQKIKQKIQNQKFTQQLLCQNRQKNSCLHVAAQYGNIQMVQNLVQHYNKLNPQVIESQSERINNLQNKKVNEKNLNGDSALIHCLKVNSENKMEKIVKYLLNYSDLRIRDKHNKLAFQVDLPVYSVSKVRVLQILKEKYEKTVK